MAKRKVRRVRRTPKNKVSSSSSPAASEKTSSRASRKELREDSFRREYAYVVKDLRQMLTVAAIMFVLLIVLNLLL